MEVVLSFGCVSLKRLLFKLYLLFLFLQKEHCQSSMEEDTESKSKTSACNELAMMILSRELWQTAFQRKSVSTGTRMIAEFMIMMILALRTAAAPVDTILYSEKRIRKMIWFKNRKCHRRNASMCDFCASLPRGCNLAQKENCKG